MRLATRASALALAQAEHVAGLLGGAEIVPMTTTGDRDRSTAGDKERWVKELEVALADGDVDLAVHSAKDVPGVLPEGLGLVGAPAREDPRDALVGAPSLAGLPANARVGTSSLRRAAQLLAVRPDLRVQAIRGNVDTRLRKLADGEVDALVLAVAGLRRLGREEAVDALLDDVVPAAGQGVLALEARTGDDDARRAAERITDPDAWTALSAERALVRMLDADCRTPVGAHAAVEGPNLRLRAFVGRPDGSAWVRDELDGPAGDPAGLGEEVGRRLLSAGAGEVLGR